MCGIAGIIREAGLVVAPQQLDKMANRIAHRGPDDSGIWRGNTSSSYRDSHVGFAHRRLSILDIEGGVQPMLDKEQTTVVAFNGQIYNHIPLRRRLASLGFSFQSDHSDTEVLVAGMYEQAHHSKEAALQFLNDLDGMFAFAAYHRPSHRLLLARDNMGKKPLYVASSRFFKSSSKIRLAFASELSALAHHPDAEPQISPHALGRFLACDFVPDPDCIYQHVFKIPAGHFLWLDADDIPVDLGPQHTQAFWDLCFRRRDLPHNHQERLAAVRSVLEDAVATRLHADVPVGVFLSGGIDSSLVAALAAKHHPRIETFSIAFREKSFDESSHARLVAKHIGSTHHEELLDASSLSDILPRVVDHLAEPFADHSIVPTYTLARLARRNVTVALGGDGGDELFLGYPTFVAEALVSLLGMATQIPWANQWMSKSSSLVTKLLPLLPVSHDNLSLDFKLKQFLRGAGAASSMRRHQLFLTGMDTESTLSLLSPDVRRTLQSEQRHSQRDLLAFLDDLEHQARRHGAQDVYDVVSYGYMKTYLSAGVMQKVDRATMAHGLEARAPMLDRNFVDVALSLHSSEKLRFDPLHPQRGYTTKAFLKEMARGLIPDEIIDRPKKGFGMPVASWLVGPLRPQIEELLSTKALMEDGLLDPIPVRKLLGEHLTKRANHRKTLWAIFMYRWWRTRVHG